jgi:hypothetical protein
MGTVIVGGASALSTVIVQGGTGSGGGGGGGGAGGTLSTLAFSGIPMIVPSNGTVATNGAITLVTALPAVFPAAWVYLPAGAVAGGAAGVYYATFSSTTVGTVYTAFATPQTTVPWSPYIPAGPVAATGSNAAYTQITGGDIILVNALLPGGSLGNNGLLRLTAYSACPTNGNTKTFSMGIQGGNINGVTLTNNLTVRTQIEIHNMGDQQHQSFLPSSSGWGASANAVFLGTQNLANDQVIVAMVRLAVATDYGILLQTLFETKAAS